MRAVRAGGNPDDWFSHHLRLSLRKLDFEGPFGWGRASAEDFCAALKRLRELEGLAWREILNHQGRNNHPIQVSRLTSDAQDRLRELREEEYDELYSFRVTGRYRIWGIRVDQTCFLLWYDPNHLVYPVNVADN